MYPSQQQPQNWPQHQQPWQETGHTGQAPRPYLPPTPPRKTPWAKILVGVVTISVAMAALMITAARNAKPDFDQRQGRTVCALLIGGRTVDEVAEKVAGRYGWTVSEARNVAREMQGRGCKP